ncbi:hypothetical protein IPH92_04380 [Candidatus Kaiserbacteria bacterium]|nr:MAG: hypothetical protein IPH92_04380 [Candidatus Kaiserbacteria bacterium]
MRTSFTYKSTHIIAIIGHSFFVGSALLLWVFFTQVEQHKIHLRELSETYARIEQNRDIFASLVIRLDETRSARESLQKHILPQDGVIDFLTLIENIGREQQVVLKTNTIIVRPLNTTFETMVVNISAEGSYASLTNTLKIFEHLPYQVSIRNVQFTNEEDETDMWSSTYDIEVTQFN